MKSVLFILIISFIVMACDTSKLSETKKSWFEGKWRLEGRGIYEGIEIELRKGTQEEYIGTVLKLNDNKYVRMFMESGDKFISGISRNSNFQFTLKEKKIAGELFSAYGLNTTQDYLAEFAGMDTIKLGTDGMEGRYVRIK